MAPRGSLHRRRALDYLPRIEVASGGVLGGGSPPPPPPPDAGSPCKGANRKGRHSAPPCLDRRRPSLLSPGTTLDITACRGCLHDFHVRPREPPDLLLTVVHANNEFLTKMQALLSMEADALKTSW